MRDSPPPIWICSSGNLVAADCVRQKNARFAAQALLQGPASPARILLPLRNGSLRFRFEYEKRLQSSRRLRCAADLLRLTATGERVPRTTKAVPTRSLRGGPPGRRGNLVAADFVSFAPPPRGRAHSLRRRSSSSASGSAVLRRTPPPGHCEAALRAAVAIRNSRPFVLASSVSRAPPHGGRAHSLRRRSSSSASGSAVLRRTPPLRSLRASDRRHWCGNPSPPSPPDENVCFVRIKEPGCESPAGGGMFHVKHSAGKKGPRGRRVFMCGRPFLNPLLKKRRLSLIMR